MQGRRGNEPRLNIAAPDHNGTVLIEVEGELGSDNAPRWAGLLRGAIDQGASGLAIDLRGCREMSAACLVPVMEAADALKSDGRPGVALVVLPGSALERQLASTADVNGAPTYATLADALGRLRAERPGRTARFQMLGDRAAARISGGAGSGSPAVG
jgi:hypothetical protein